MVCRTRVFEFKLPNESMLEWSNSSTLYKGNFILYINARKFISKWCTYHFLRVNDSSVEVPYLHYVTTVKEFPDVFPNYLPGVPPLRELEFGISIDIIIYTRAITISPYRMEPES